ncbi:hypothetical protein [Nocardia sp. bgisy134]|uniref:hypothetical protein n=1 Tax=unclassified Nocardia TaxID=2637762 RepID=UPI003D72960F
MTDILIGLGKRLSETWFTAIALPGLLYTALAVWAALAAHRHALDPGFVSSRVQSLTRGGRDLAALTVWAILLLAAATLAGFLAALVAENLVHRWWIRVARPVRRDRRQAAARERWQDRHEPPPARYLPTRATAVGEHFRLLGERVDAEYGLSLVHAWPRLWLLIGAERRELVVAAQRGYFTDALLVAWGVLLLPWAVWWWPAALLASAAVLTGAWRARDSSRVLATLMESTLDIHQADLAEALGVELPSGRITVDLGNQINDILNKRA